MDIENVDNPELIIGLVGPIGVDLETVTHCLKDELAKVGYKTHEIRVTDLMRGIDVGQKIDDSSYVSKYKSLIGYADAVCEKCESNSALVGLAILKIRELRAASSGEKNKPDLGRAYILRQFKRPDEITELRKTYGRKFIQVSVFLDREKRKETLIKKIREFDSTPRNDSECEQGALELIAIDFEESDVMHGQRISKVFHLGDVFVPGDRPTLIEETIERFTQAFFGHNGLSPNKDEYGLYVAAAASLRSIDLSRQVGAAICTSDGEILSIGCNEVPKAFGGTYWTEDTEPHRDFDENSDANLVRQMEILHDLLNRLDKKGYLSDSLKSLGDTDIQVKALWDEEEISDAIMFDTLEFGRMIHAEMSAICDAARLGRSVKEATLFCTTFPCHMCAKHIVASGINRVVFLEPYPKSYAEKLHSDSISFETTESQSKIVFEPFLGISPRRYRDIFEKGSRRGSDKKPQVWSEGKPLPRIEDKTANYILNETPVMAVCFNKYSEKILSDLS